MQFVTNFIYKNILLLFLIYIGVNFQCQSTQDKLNIFTYRLKYLPDSTNLEDIKEEDFNLQIVGKRSCFVSENYKNAYYAIKMSTFNSSNVSNINLSNLPKTNFNMAIYKENDSINFYDSYFGFKYNYTETAKFNWKITKEKKKLGEFICFKAVTHYGGREWEAWFTESLPFNDGPYKFNGLPGLIIEIYDIRKNFHFSLIQVNVIEDSNILFKDDRFKKYTKITKEKYFEIRDNLRDNYLSTAGSKGVSLNIEDKIKIQKKLNSRNNYFELKP